MKLFGHPVHMMLIHFPSALLPMDFVCSLVAWISGNQSFAHAGYFAMVGGVSLGFLAIVTGAFDVIGVADEKPLALKKALIHGSINTTVVVGYAIFAFRAYRDFPDIATDNVISLIIKGLLLTLMIAGNYLGGNLILKYGVGVQKNKPGEI